MLPVHKRCAVSHSLRRANRHRILATAADALGFIGQIDTISDNAASASAPHRGVIPTIDVTYNSTQGREQWAAHVAVLCGVRRLFCESGIDVLQQPC